MKTLRVTAILAAFCLIAGAAFAQEGQDQEGRGQLLQVQVLRVPPAQVAAFQEAAREVVQTASESQVGAEYGWHMWSDDFHYTIVSPIPNFAAFDDPTGWVRQFGEEGGAKLQEIFERVDEEIKAQTISREISEMVPKWTYQPEGAPEARYGTLYTFTIAPDKYRDFEPLATEFVEAWKQMSYPYSIWGHRVHFGKVNKVHFLIAYDAPSAFFGENSPGAAANRAGMSEAFQQLLVRLNETIDAMETNLVQYHADLSYEGPQSGSETGDSR